MPDNHLVINGNFRIRAIMATISDWQILLPGKHGLSEPAILPTWPTTLH